MFNFTAKEKPPVVSGAETLRAYTHVRNRKGILGNMARDVGLSLVDLDDWAEGRRAQLDVAALEKIAVYLDTKYDAATDTLVSAYSQKITASNYAGPPTHIPINMSPETLAKLPPRLPIKQRAS